MSDPKLKGLQKGFEIKERLLMTAGMTNISGRVKSAMISPLITVNDPQYEQLLKDIIEGIRYIFQTTNKYTFAITGPTSLAFETAICNVLNPNDKILVVIHGVEAERMAKSSRFLGFKLIRLQVVSPGELIDKETIKKALESHKPKLLHLCHGDPSVGTLQPLRGIGALCHQHDCLFMVDYSATVCCAPLAMDTLEIDVLIAGTQYAVGIPPGLSLLSFNKKATEKIREKAYKLSYTMDFKLLVQSWGLAEDPKIIYHYTPAISLLYALRESLAMVVEEGLQNVFQRHIKMSLLAQREITKIGLRFLVDEETKRLPSVLVIVTPDGIKREAVVEYLLRYYDIQISYGISPIDKVWRIGIMGPNANRRAVKIITTALREAIEVAKRMSNKGGLGSPSVVQSNI